MAAALELTAPNGTKYSQPTGLFINNEFVPATSGEKIETINPYDESVIATVEAAGEKDVDAAVAAARAAFKTGSEWRNLTPQERGVLLGSWGICVSGTRRFWRRLMLGITASLMMLFLVRMWRRLFRFSGTMRVGRIRFMGRLLMLGMRSLLIPSMSRSVCVVRSFRGTSQ